MAAHVDALRTHAPNVSPDGDPEELHKARVAVRRLRALLRAARPLIEYERAEPLRAALAELGRALAPARDADVLLAHLREEAASLDEPEAPRLLERLETERLQAHAAARAALDDASFGRLLRELDAFCTDVPIRTGSLDGVVKREATKLRRAMRRATTDEELHAARIRAKRVRYAAEAAGAEAIVERAKRFQDVVGEHQDAVVAEARLRELADAQTAIVAGRLIERQAERRRRALVATPKAWKRLAKALR